MIAQGTGPDGAEWRRTGSAEVAVQEIGPGILEWRESGDWQEVDERPTSFRNRLRWTWDVPLGRIQLHHLRRGADRPVHLVDLAGAGPGALTSEAPHHCAADRYLAELILGGDSFELRWQVTGPSKRYFLSTIYLP